MKPQTIDQLRPAHLTENVCRPVFLTPPSQWAYIAPSRFEGYFVFRASLKAILWTIPIIHCSPTISVTLPPPILWRFVILGSPNCIVSVTWRTKVSRMRVNKGTGNRCLCFLSNLRFLTYRIFYVGILCMQCILSGIRWGETVTSGEHYVRVLTFCIWWNYFRIRMISVINAEMIKEQYRV